MAITSVATLDLTQIPASQVPSGYTPPTATTLSAPTRSAKTTMTLAASGFEDASSAVTGITAGVAAVKTEFDTNIDTTVLKLDAAATINVNLYITNLKRVNTRPTEYRTGTENMEITYYIEWE